LAIVILSLFILSIFAPISISQTKGVDKESIIENYVFDSYHVSEITNYDFKEINTFDLKPSILTADKVLVKKKPIQAVNSGLMDSAWPMYCQNVRHTGRSPYNPVEYPIEKWRYDVEDGGDGSPVLDYEGTIYFGGFNLYAIYPNSTLKWVNDIHINVQASPAIDEDGIIYIGDSQGGNTLHAYYPNGTLKWIREYGSIFSSCAIGEDGTVYFGRRCGDEGAIVAVYPNNGSLKWIFNTNHVVYSSPAIGDDGTIYCGSHDGNLYALNPNNGTEKWHYHTDHWIRTSPCIADDRTIYVVSLDSYLHAVYPNGTLKWKTNVGAGTSPTIGQDGTIYCGYTYLHAVSPNGTIKWSFDPGGGRKIRGGTPCNDANGTIYFGTSIDDLRGGEIIAVNSDGTEQWRKLLSSKYIEAAPCIAEDGTIYIVSNGYIDGSVCYLHAFGTVESNNPPEMETLEGTIEGEINVHYKYIFSAIDPDNNPVAYFIDWGDGTTDGWTMDYAPNVEVFLWHRWDEEGNYTIKAKARDSVGEESDWMYLEVTMPFNQPIQYPLIQLLLERFPNAFPIMRHLLGL